MIRKLYFFLAFFAVAIFFAGVEVANSPISNDSVINPSVVEQTDIPENKEDRAMERIKEQEPEVQSIFSQTGTWLGDSISNGFVQMLEKIFS